MHSRVPPRLVSLILLCFGFLLPVTLANAGTPADLDRENGLPDAKLGTPIEAFKGMEPVEELGRWVSYRRPSDRLTYGKFELNSITYNFFKGKLFSIFLGVEGKRNTRGILKLLEQTYGPDHTLEKQAFKGVEVTMETREWTGSRVYLLYKNGNNFEGGQITLLDRPTWNLLQVPKQEQAAEVRKMMSGSYIGGDF